MSQKTIQLPDIGEVVLSKRKGAKNIRLSVSAAGRVRVGLPSWAPYAAGIAFAKSRSEWINKQLQTHQISQHRNGSRIGKSYRLNYIFKPEAVRTSTKITDQTVSVTSHLALQSSEVQTAIVKAGERALKKEAIKLLPPRLAELARQNGFSYKNVSVKKLTSRWGSCSSDKAITLNYFLMQLPWNLIDYVLVHELIHTKHLNHSQRFWQDFEAVYPGAKAARKLIRQHRPVINSVA